MKVETKMPREMEREAYALVELWNNCRKDILVEKREARTEKWKSHPPQRLVR